MARGVAKRNKRRGRVIRTALVLNRVSSVFTAKAIGRGAGHLPLLRVSIAGSRSGYSATAANVERAVERRILLVNWIVRIRQVFLRWHLIGARLGIPPRGLYQRLPLYVHRRKCDRISRTTQRRWSGYLRLWQRYHPASVA